MSLNESRNAYEEWLRSARDLSEFTIRAYISDVTALERFLGPSFDPSQITAPDLLSFAKHKADAGCASSTIRRRMTGLRGFFQWLAKEGTVRADPTVMLDLRFSRPRRLPRAVSPTDLTLLVRYLSSAAELTTNANGPRTGPRRSTETTTLVAVLLMVGTGVRVGEITGARLSQVDLESGTIRIVGKGHRERMVFLSNPWIVSLLEFYIRHREHDEAGDPPLLINRGGQPLTASALRGRLARAATAAGVQTHLTPHMLRHTAATQLIEAGVDIRFVQRLLGHASLTTTEIYTHVADRSLRRAVTEADVIGQLVTLR